jgi:hypothetical protein
VAVEVIRKLICDVGENKHEATHTLSFAVSGDRFEVDVCDRHSQAFDKDLQPWITSGRRAATAKRKAGSNGAKKPAYDAEVVRNWAKLTGLAVSDTGRLSPTTIKKWRDAGSPGA